MGFGMNKSLKNMICLSLLMGATVGSTMRAADNKDNKKIENVIEKQPVVQKKGSLWNPMNWFRKQPVVKPVEIKPAPAPKKQKIFVPLVKNFAKRAVVTGTAVAGCYWFAKSNALESLLRMGGHDELASRIADPLTKTLAGAVTSVIVYRQASKLKSEFVERGTECFVDKMLSKVVDNEKFGPFAEKCIGGGVDEALKKPSVQERLNEAVKDGIASNISKLNLSLINRSGASSQQVTQLEEKFGKQLETQKTEQDRVNQLVLEQQKKMLETLESLKPKPWYFTRVLNFIASKFKKNGSSKEPANQSVTLGSTDTTKPEDKSVNGDNKNQQNKINKE